MTKRKKTDHIPEVAPLDRDPLPCPVCGRSMRVESKGRVSVDVCARHGIWLDQGELENICAAIRSAAAASRHLAVRMARESGRRHGARYRWWSLFMD